MNNKKQTSSIHVVLKTLQYIFPAAWKFRKSYFFLFSFQTFIVALQPFVDIFFIPLIITELTKGSSANFKYTLTLASIMILGNLILNYLARVLDISLQKYDDTFQNWASLTCSEKCMDMDFYLTEDKNALDQIEKARQGMQWYSGGVHGITKTFFSIISNFIKLIGVIFVIASKAPLLLIVTIIIILLSAGIQQYLNKIEFASYKNMSSVNRIFWYFLFNISDFQYAKDIRLYGSTGMMVNKTLQAINKMLDIWRTLARKQNLPYHLLGIISVIRDFLTYFYLGFLTLTKVISIGVFQQLLTSASVVHFSLQGIIKGVQEIVQKSSYAYEFVKFMEYPSAMVKGTMKPESKINSIEFKHVSFSYPGSEKKVLKDISLKITEGEHLSIVGLNGEGKTTFIKLLCRLYDVSSGEILVNGRNIKDFSFSEYAKLFSVVFQDFKLFAFEIKENITMDNIDANIDDIYKEVDLFNKLNSLPNKDKTIMYKAFDKKGIELSGGEQQKLAIARALYKDAPIIILDEPTAALDPIAEYEIYKQFDSLTGGKTAIYISHRLSSCQFCDKIALFSEGKVLEYGTHSELLQKQNGLYAKMFEAQAQYYK